LGNILDIPLLFVKQQAFGDRFHIFRPMISIQELYLNK